MLTCKREMLFPLALLAWVVAGGAPAGACDVPVFRYALECWPAEPYAVVVLHRGELTAGAKEVVDTLRRAPAGHGGSANLSVRTVDLSAEVNAPMPAMWREQEPPDLPRIIVVYPPAAAVGKVCIWAAPLSMSAARAVVDSPARREIAQRLMNGESAVWVLLESGERNKDEAAANLLTEELAKMPEKLTLPLQASELNKSGASSTGSGIESGVAEVKIAFSVLRLSRTDPAEKMLAAMLVRSEEDLERGYASQPMVFPVFGRGRVLYALVGKGITARNILTACRFLTGPCACEVKEDNPGVDLLMNADWDASIATSLIEEVELPPLTGVFAQVDGSGSTARPALQTQVRGPVEAGKPSRLLRNTVIALAAIVAAVGALSVVMKRPSSGK